MTKFWLQEELPASKHQTLSADEEECERHFQTTHSRDATGRYVVRLPFKSSPTALGESKAKALSCLNRMFQRFSSNSEFRQLYVNFIEEYKTMGHMVATDISNNRASPVYYLPHHGVIRESSVTTKLRVVFNGSSRTSNGLSLNDILYAVHPDDWDLQRILWQEQHSQPIAYQLTTVTYGLNCAPFLALRTIQQLVSDEGYRFPLAIVPMSKGRYVDDIFGGADTISEAKDIVRDVIQLCETGGFPLQKWNSNCLELLPKSNSGSSSTVEIEPTHLKILGLIWKPNTDTFHFTAATSPTTVFTKRTIASDIAKLYDPLGLIAPILIRAKILLQELWLLKVEWDEPLSPELEQRWTTFRKQLHQLDQLSIPRWLGIVRSNTSVELHGFSDASQLAMAAVIYARVSGNDGKVSVQLICSKTKVAPIKKLTIPRLELTAALLLARLMVHTVNAHDLPNVTTFCWSDSSVALTWITTQSSCWKDFVRNRVSSIQELQSNTSWRFVPGKENPADCASRGLRSDQLIQHDLWWKGPDWLSKSQTSWPSI
ncbi:PREDICTED: uncharacterized protein LOC105559116, partial [Vollenhovia emeryi]|uniref:uncharacterized protein LOC105559116 n=1 Tax=Vollenhovia emeryi TaxID=411798 RepID=UPI0005F3933B